jgi:RNA polymerase sigma-70 factor, ECF subfamily
MSHMPLSDANLDLDLLRRIRAADESAADAFTTLYRRHQAPLYRFALLRTGAQDVAADIVQDVFVALMEGKLAFDATRGSLANFLFGVARNFALKRDEAQRRYVSTVSHSGNDLDDDEGFDHAAQLLDSAPTPVEKLLDDHRAESVRAALAQLAPHYRDVVILYEMHDMSYVEIAHICNIDLGTVRSRLFRAREKLIALLGHLQDHTESESLKSKARS